MAQAEIIELMSDEDEESGKKGNACNSNCINFKCRSGVNMNVAPSFACAFYGASLGKKRKKRVICEECFNVALQHQKLLVQAFVKNTSLLECPFPDHTMEVEISDSDDSDGEKKETDSNEYIPEDVLLDISNKLEDTLSHVYKKYNVEQQTKIACESLKKRWRDVNAANESLNTEIRDMMRTVDKLRNRLYNDFRPQIKMLQELQINDEITETSHPLVATKKVTQVRVPPSLLLQDSQLEVLAIEPLRTKETIVPNLPPNGPVIKRAPAIDDIVYIMKTPVMPWIKAKVQSIVATSPSWIIRVKLVQKKYNSAIKTICGKLVALTEVSKVIIPVGTRVVAIFRDDVSNNYYSGIIAETPKSINKYRYLVFFDDGYAQYVVHTDIYLVWETSLRIWEDIPSESREFVKKYMESYPERPMVKLQPGQMVKTEWKGKWWLAKVMQVDASLVQMHFNADKRTEWIYRGSTRLGPLYIEALRAIARQKPQQPGNAHSRHRIPVPANKNNLPYVEYTSNVEEDAQNVPAEKAAVATSVASGTPSAAPQQSRAVAKKSTARRQTNVDTTYNSTVETKPSHSIVFYHKQGKFEPKKYVAHKCGPKCIKSVKTLHEDLKGLSPLSIPLLCGWHRQLCKFSKGKKVILYQTPCGVRLRNIEELHRYLRTTSSTLSVDLFDFDYWVRAFADFVVEKCFINIKDLSYGVENVPIACVNDLDHTQPDTIKYTTRREPTEGVHLNLDPAFLCSCDCEDDCQDKEKCQCWQMTIQGATLGGKVPNTAVGYVYKRLPEPVTTGIYECNSGCKCSVKTCLNRVVQHPLRLKLQVFKTGPRGWGIRCLNDVPHGAFICIYAGRLLTEQGANEGGKNYGDEYLAELDYVEVVEGFKEGYESDVLEPELSVSSTEDDSKKKASDEEEDNTKESTNDSDEDFNIDSYVNSNKDLLETTAESSSIRKRLRKRKRHERDNPPNAFEETSEDGSITRGLENMAKSFLTETHDTINISDDDDSRSDIREPSRFEPSVEPKEIEGPKLKSVRDYFGEDEAVYIMDAKTTGNIGRYLNHSCDPNVFVQNVFVDTHDVRFPWVAFFALQYIKAGQELTWNYSYDVGSIPGKVIVCKCGAANCRGRLL
ncbi:PREDICTED: histone-lysine N-methyltransferase SETDB1 [Vollenhovia emeryi]|uniref:histone-lysine N-methyltransferase SETDB1 n=1 Tax=Vollenhovia emeryi TaxID=411798 RepID=UPI0005F4027E|nr:PREDICTED: histone-lysine N-methyltransferase SETDB1 [Vollenhovia emeryi]